MDEINGPAVPLLTVLRQIHHPNGDVYHAMKATDAGYAGFGEAYFTTVHCGAIKGWKLHTKMQMNLVVPVGIVRFYVHDATCGTTTQFELGAENYARLTVPPGLWMAFSGIGPALNLVCNLANIAHDPLEAINVSIDTYPLENDK